MFDGREPIYLQIADRIRADVVSGVLEEGEQVMSTTQYATTYRINPATAAKAFAELVDEGVLHKRRGIGMFVSEGARERLVAERRERFFSDVLEPAAAEARVLGIPVELLVERLRALDTPYAAHGASTGAAPAGVSPADGAPTSTPTAPRLAATQEAQR